ncbi:MAG: EAL domain-containing protein [Chromatiaceae bacterium]|nr:EAL domain-containing protein [Chromatiaceae bacterium]
MKPSESPNPALRITLIYLAFALGWILLSDWLLNLFVEGPRLLTALQTFKDLFYVFITALGLFALLHLGYRQLAQSELTLRLFIENAPAALAMLDRDLHHIAISRRWMSDYGLEDRNIIGTHHYAIFPEVPERWREVHRRALAGEVLRADCDCFERPDGRVQWVRWEVRPWHRPNGDIGGIIIFSEDISHLKEAEREMRIAATAFESQQSMLITDHKGQILRVNRAFSATTGYSAAEVMGQTPAILKSGRHDAAFYREMWESIASEHAWQGEIWNRRKNGEIYPEWLNIAAVTDNDGAITNYVGSFLDLSQHKQAEAKIHSLSYYDVLTNLPNRRLLLDRLQQALLSSRRTGQHGAILFIDIDDFSAINDTQGHDVGDKTLIEIARRLLACVHGDDSVARPGGDEFIVIVENLGKTSAQALLDARQVAERIQTAIRQPLFIDGSEYAIRASIGISLFEGVTGTVEDIMKRADVSMRQVKRLGRDHIQFFDDQMQEALEQRVRLESQLRRAIPEQLLLHYQIQRDRQGAPRGAEALVRWHQPEEGLISPAAFIPLAEDSGLILPLGAWVLETASRQLNDWTRDFGAQDFSIAVNISAKQFYQEDFVEQVLRLLASSGADPQRLKLELTESILLEDVDAVARKMTRLKSEGLRFSLDDFGTGFSSLAYLRRLPLDELKIDQSFVRDLRHDSNDAAIVRTIIALGETLGLEVIAEGVETQEQLDYLTEHGCQGFQGYLFGKPVTASDFAATYLRRH